MNSLAIVFVVGISACCASVIPAWGGATVLASPAVGGAVIAGPSGTVATKAGWGGVGGLGWGGGAVAKTVVAGPVAWGGANLGWGGAGLGWGGAGWGGAGWGGAGWGGKTAIIGPSTKTVVVGSSGWADNGWGWSGKGW